MKPRTATMGDALGASPMVVCRDLRKSFGDVEVLRAFQLEVKPGEKVAIIGPSGSGKTTVLRIIMALEEPTSGVVMLGGDQLWGGKERPRERDLRRVRAKAGYVFQQFNLFPHMTALENVVAAPVYVRRMPRSDATVRAMDLLTTVGLERKADSYPAQLSGGQQQRVAIARALALDPEIMLFDEVTSALDPELVGEVLRVIGDLAVRTNMTMLLVTHEMTFARRVADRVLFLDHGEIVEEGSPEQIFDAPQKDRTRAFLRAILDPG